MRVPTLTNKERLLPTYTLQIIGHFNKWITSHFNNATLIMFSYLALLISYVYTVFYTIYCILPMSCKTGMSVFCHGQRRAQISIPLSTSGTCLNGGWGLGPFPPRNGWELAGALVEECGKSSQQDLANLVQSMGRRCTSVLIAAGGHTRYWL